MKSLFLFLFLALGFSLSAQQNDLKWLDIMLANYDYPFPAKHLDLNVQQQDLKMAYMDVKPENHNGKNVLCCCMVRILTALTGKLQPKH
jgi:hypothetical protein